MTDGRSGTTAIAGFFAISGFLMARTISENYRGRTPQFYLNRVIRIGPPLAAVMVVTALALWSRHSQPFQITLPAGAYMPVELPSSLNEVMSWNWQGFPLYVYPSFRLLPQAWSLITESAFYLVAPALVLMFGRRVAAIHWVVPLASLNLAINAYGSNWLRSPFAALWIFWLGMQAYFFGRAIRWSDVAGARARQGAVAPVLLVIAMGAGFTSVPEGVIAFVVPVLVGIWLVLGQWHARRSLWVDGFFGNLSYGVFLGHYLSTITMFWIAEAVYRTTGRFGVFGVPDVTEQRLRVSAFCFALLFGVLIHYSCERPLEQVRSRVRVMRT